MSTNTSRPPYTSPDSSDTPTTGRYVASTSTASSKLQPLRRRKINRRVNKKDGVVRLSAEYDVTADDGTVDGYVRIRLDQTARDKLTGYKMPRHIEFLDELPKSNVGKILRRELRDIA